MFDLDVMDTKSLSETGVEMEVRNITDGEPLKNSAGEPIVIRVLGPDSSVYRRLTRQQVQKRFERAQRQQNITADAYAEAEADAVEILVACTVGWRGILGKDKEPVPFSKEAARKLYEDYPAIREQVDSFASSRANFTKASLKA